MKIRAALVRKPRRRPQFLPKRRLTLRERNPYPACALAALIAGLAGGALPAAADLSDLNSRLFALLRQFAAARDIPFAARVWAVGLPSIGLGLLILYLGFSPVGTPGVAALLFLRGCGLGALAVCLAQTGGKAGVAFYFACLFPAKALQTCGLFLLAARAMQCSGYIKSCLKRGSFQLNQVWIGYGRAGLPGLALLVVAAPVDALLQQNVIPFFASLLR